MYSITYQVATSEHINSIAALHTLSWQKTYQHILDKDYLERIAPTERLRTWSSRFDTENPKQHVVIAFDNEKVVGFICVFADNDNELGNLLDNLHVHPDYHGKGIGKSMMSNAAVWLKQHADSSSLYLEVLADNQDAIAVYEKLGAKRIKKGQWHAPSGALINEYIYQWDLLDSLL